MNNDEIFIGDGAYGKVYFNSKLNIVKKIIPFQNKFLRNKYLNIIENNFIEIFFYYYLQNALQKAPKSISHYKDINYIYDDELKIYKEVHIIMPHYGFHITKIKMSLNKLRKYIFQILEAIYFLHINKISHGDIKPCNILINSDLEQATLIDFGSCHSYNFNSISNQINLDLFYRCTINYISPEELLNQRYYNSNDIWSLGCVLFEVITGNNFLYSFISSLNKFDLKKITKNNSESFDYLKYIFSIIFQNQIDQFIDSVFNNLIMSFNKDITKSKDLLLLENYKIIIKNCLQINVKNRFNIIDLIELSFFSKFNKEFNYILNIDNITEKLSIKNKLEFIWYQKINFEPLKEREKFIYELNHPKDEDNLSILSSKLKNKYILSIPLILYFYDVFNFIYLKDKFVNKSNHSSKEVDIEKNNDNRIDFFLKLNKEVSLILGFIITTNGFPNLLLNYSFINKIIEFLKLLPIILKLFNPKNILNYQKYVFKYPSKIPFKNSLSLKENNSYYNDNNNFISIEDDFKEYFAYDF